MANIAARKVALAIRARAAIGEGRKPSQAEEGQLGYLEEFEKRNPAQKGQIQSRVDIRRKELRTGAGQRVTGGEGYSKDIKRELIKQPKQKPLTTQQLARARSLTHEEQFKQYGGVVVETEKPLTQTQEKRASSLTEEEQRKEFGRVIYQVRYEKEKPLDTRQSTLETPTYSADEISKTKKEFIPIASDSTSYKYGDVAYKPYGEKSRTVYPQVQRLEESRLDVFRKSFKSAKEKVESKIRDKKILSEVYAGAKKTPSLLNMPYKFTSEVYGKYLDPSIKKIKGELRVKSLEYYERPGLVSKAKGIGVGALGVGAEAVQYTGKKPLESSLVLTAFGKIGKLGQVGLIGGQTAFAAYKAEPGLKVKTAAEHILLFSALYTGVKGLQLTRTKLSGIDYRFKGKTYKPPTEREFKVETTGKEINIRKLSKDIIVKEGEGLIKKYPRMQLPSKPAKIDQPQEAVLYKQIKSGIKKRSELLKLKEVRVRPNLKSEQKITIGDGIIKKLGETSKVTQTVVGRKVRGTIRTSEYDIQFEQVKKGLRLKYFEKNTDRLVKERVIKRILDYPFEPIKDQPTKVLEKRVIELGDKSGSIKQLKIKSEKQVSARAEGFKRGRDISKQLEAKSESLLTQTDKAGVKVKIKKFGKREMLVDIQESEIKYALQPIYKPHITKQIVEGFRKPVPIKEYTKQPTLGTKRTVKTRFGIDIAFRESQVKPLKATSELLKSMGKRGELLSPPTQIGKRKVIVEAEEPILKIPKEDVSKRLLTGEEVKKIISFKQLRIKGLFPSIKEDVIQEPKTETRVKSVLETKQPTVTEIKTYIKTITKPMTKTRSLTETKAESRVKTRTDTKTQTKVKTEVKTLTKTLLTKISTPPPTPNIKFFEPPTKPIIPFDPDLPYKQQRLTFPKLPLPKQRITTTYTPTLVGTEFMKPIRATKKLGRITGNPFTARPVALPTLSRKKKKKKIGGK